ncbi:hypothetical protein VPH35_115074 [Triticum aestivum]
MASLMDDVTAEILLRLPPDEPEHLFRAALVCKPWLRILCDPGFLRRYRAFHGTPPLLGLLHRLRVIDGDAPARFASTTSAPDFPHPSSDGRRTRPLDCRHGRVLVRMLENEDVDYLVWDPVTGDRHAVPTPDIESAAVLCAADGCDHLDCHGGPFRVLFAATHDYEDTICASVYSSETGALSEPVCLNDSCETFAKHMREGEAYRRYYTPYLHPKRGTVVGDAVYFTVRLGNAIVKYDLGKNSLSMIDPPPHTILYIWSRKVDTEGPAEWVQYRVIELEKTIPVAKQDEKPFVAGSAEGVGVIFVCTGAGLFMIKLSSGQLTKVDEPGVYFRVLPYMSFYTPDRGRMLSISGEDKLIS